MSSCLPCELERAEPAAVVYRDDTWSCDVAEGYDVPGWFILRLRRHAEGWSELTAEDLAGFGPISQRIAAAIQSATGATGVYFMSFGENYPHFHFLITARPQHLAPHSRGAGILAARADYRDMAASLQTASAVRDALATT